MADHSSGTQDAGAAADAPEVAHLVRVFLDQLRAHGRVHHRALLSAMRRHLEKPATERAQEVAMLLRRKLCLRPQEVRDIESVREALAAKAEPGEDSR